MCATNNWFKRRISLSNQVELIKIPLLSIEVMIGTICSSNKYKALNTDEEFRILSVLSSIILEGRLLGSKYNRAISNFIFATSPSLVFNVHVYPL